MITKYLQLKRLAKSAHLTLVLGTDKPFRYELWMPSTEGKYGRLLCKLSNLPEVEKVIRNNL